MLVEKMDELLKEVSVLKNKMMVNWIDGGNIQRVDTGEFERIQSCLNVFDSMMDIQLEQAKLLESMDKKLDKLLSK